MWQVGCINLICSIRGRVWASHIGRFDSSITIVILCCCHHLFDWLHLFEGLNCFMNQFCQFFKITFFSLFTVYHAKEIKSQSNPLRQQNFQTGPCCPYFNSWCIYHSVSSFVLSLHIVLVWGRLKFLMMRGKGFHFLRIIFTVDCGLIDWYNWLMMILLDWFIPGPHHDRNPVTRIK